MVMLDDDHDDDDDDRSTKSFNAHVELVLGIQSGKSPTWPALSLVSIGLVVKHFWRNLVELSRVHQQLQEERDIVNTGRSSAADAGETAEDKDKLKKQCLSPSSVIGRRPPSSVSQASSGLGSCFSSGPRCVAVETRPVGCQTVASSLVPCDACARVQNSLRTVSDALVATCQGQGLPSSLGRFLEAVDESLEHGCLSAADVAQWAAEQSRDLGRLGKHLSQLRDTIEPLKESQVALEGQRAEMKAQVKRMEDLMAREREDHRAGREQLELRLKEAQEREEEAVRRLQVELEELKQGAASLKEKNCRMEAELCAQQDHVHALEREKSRLLEEVRLLREERAAARDLEERRRSLEAELSSHKLLLEKESAKYLSACRQQEATQAKQKALLERADALDLECEELQERLGASEEACADLEERLRSTTTETERLRIQLAEQEALVIKLQEEKERLKVRASELQDEVQDLVQREKLLVAFPELSPAARRPPQSTGDILEDMEQQVRANHVRIAVLEKENAALSSSLARLRDGAQQPDAPVVSPLQRCPSVVGTGDSSGCPALRPQSFTQVQRATEATRGRRRAGEGMSSNGADGTLPWDGELSAASSHSLSSASNRLHFQTLGLQLSPEFDGAKTDLNLHRIYRTRSAGRPPRRK
ncbi:coiled-coil domain-containing protein 157-like [Scleropages formosus]|uniref:coiled-coil domain-containing protein 157-like n=1 Tax=Scleropages formosus TaxID=113540 RepID=UPI0010FA7F00|nr:coiled-coil domain-containing protein 157-like [Scleropages formosus]